MGSYYVLGYIGMEKKMEAAIVFLGYIGMKENGMETTFRGLGRSRFS